METVIINDCVELFADNDMVVHAADDSGYFEPETFGILDTKLELGGIFIDVGAYTGIYAIYAANKFENFVYAFEPNFEVNKRLNDNLVLNDTTRVFTYPIALSNQRSVSKLWSNPRTALSSGGSLEQTNSNMKLSSDVSCDVYDDLAVSVLTVDAIKIDVEGHELEVLEGMVNTLKRDRPIVIVECLSIEQSDKVVSFFNQIDYTRTYILDGRNYLFEPRTFTE